MHFDKLNFYKGILGLYLITGVAVNAEIPRNPEFKDYKHMLERSPFEIKINKIVKQAPKAAVVKPLHYYLRGVTQLESGWMIVLADRRKPKENIIIKQGVKNGFKIDLLDVIQNKKDYKETRAKVKIEGREMTIGYNAVELKQPTTPQNGKRVDSKQSKRPGYVPRRPKTSEGGASKYQSYESRK